MSLNVYRQSIVIRERSQSTAEIDWLVEDSPRCDRHEGQVRPILNEDVVNSAVGDIEVAPMMVDTVTGDREAFAGVMHYWKLGYSETLAGLLNVPVAEVERRFDEMIRSVRDEGRYAGWLLFALAAKA